ncbi:MAG: hypothetical protein AB7I27_12215 [Bacteriovoracaceae bacterium]
MIFLLLLASLNLFADGPDYWNSALEVVEKHEFYKNNELITKPSGTWQTLFALIYPSKELEIIKECVYYKIPSQEDGVLKTKRMKKEDRCDQYLLSEGDQIWPNVKALQFFLDEKSLAINLTFEKYKTEKWNYTFINLFKRPGPNLLQSSSEFKSPKVIFLAPVSSPIKTKTLALNKNSKICHTINDDCQEQAPSTCSKCPEGWYEIPNGCPQGPKYCGILECGGRNQPACRRGMRYQMQDKKFECRTDSSFAYCSKGLNVVCEGALAFCR